MKKNKTKPSSVSRTWIELFLNLGPGTLALFLGFLGMWQFHNSEFYSHFDLVPGGRGDPRLVTALLEYFHQSLHGAGKLDNPAFYFPASGALGFADVFLTYAVLYDVLRVWGCDVFSSLQACVFTADALNYICCFLLLRKGLGIGIASSGLGAFVFAFNAPKFNQISHVQLQCLFWLPLVIWCLAEWAKKGRTMKPSRAFGILALAGALLNIQLLSSFYDSWFFIFWSALFLGFVLCFADTRAFLMELSRRHLTPVAGAGAVFLAGLIPFFLVYLPVVRELGGKSYDEVKMMIPNLWAYLWMGPRQGWWGWLWDSCPSIQAFPVEGEIRLGFGLVLLILWIAWTFGAVFIIREKKTELKIQLAALVVLATSFFFLLAFQYNPDFSPWRLVYEMVPGAGSIRAVSRMVLFLALPISITLAFVFDRVWEKPGHGKGRILTLGLSMVLAVVIVWEQVDFPPYPAFDKKWELARLEYLNAKLPNHCGSFFVTLNPALPYSATDIQIDAMLVSAIRGIPTLNGYSGQSPAQWGLYKVRSPKYPEYVKNWIDSRHIQGSICELNIDR